MYAAGTTGGASRREPLEGGLALDGWNHVPRRVFPGRRRQQFGTNVDKAAELFREVPMLISKPSRKAVQVERLCFAAHTTGN